MTGVLGRVFMVGAMAVAAAAIGTGGASAATLPGTDPQIVDISKQLTDMQKQLANLQATGGTAKEGRLAAEADCGFGDPSQVFLPWGDDADYSLIPGGDLADTTRWTLKNTTAAAEHDPFTAGTGSLALRGDAEVVTPVMCVSLAEPTLRLFLADRGGDGHGSLEVKVLYDGLDGKTHALTVARLRAGEAWQPSVVIPIGVNVLAAASANGWTPVAFDFKPRDLRKGETFSIDGVYVDPCRSR
jgi:hypothetical protein